MQQPDLLRAATLALETLIKHRVSFAPVSPLPILKATPGVIVMSWADMAATVGMDRSCVLDNLSDQTRDATTVIDLHGGRPHYLIGYNRQLPTYMADRALARELGHVVLSHDGTGPEDVWMEEASSVGGISPSPFFCRRRLMTQAMASHSTPLAT